MESAKLYAEMDEYYENHRCGECGGLTNSEKTECLDCGERWTHEDQRRDHSD